MAREMKDSGIEWIGEIPDGWIIRPLKGVTKRIIVGLATSVTQYYRNNGIPLFRNLNIKDDRLLDDDILFLDEEWASTQTGKMIRAGDILTVHTGYIGISCIVPEQYDNALTFTTLITTPKPDLIDTRFLMRYINVSRFYSPVYFNVETGAQNNLNTKAFINLEICVPDQMEQKRIIAFLDEECSRIDSVIDQTRASIEEYKKLKQAVITQAVTKGIRPDRHMKDSGVEWIGDIPADWLVMPFKAIAVVKSNLVDPNDYATYLQVSPENIEKGSGILLPCKTVSEVGVISGNHLFYEGQILYSKIRPKLNKTTIAPFDGLCSADMYPIEAKQHTKFLLYAMLSDELLSQVSMITEDRVKMPKINQDELGNTVFAVPPFAEQCEIADYIDKKTEQISGLIKKKESLLSSLESYKKSLIYEYVTGKKEVPA